ncbi:MAG: N-6 DNA methylase, partial [Campylobacterota bacterium]|nr:N-6 DNA methylase [Campylobacterota bacterium]
MSISTVIKSIQKIMREDAGVDGDAQRISQLVWLIFLKVIDTKEEEYELYDDDYISAIPEHLRWNSWASDDEGITGDELLELVNNDLFPTLKELNLDEQSSPLARTVKTVFEDSFNYMKSGTTLRRVINKLNEIHFERREDRHLFNDIYEQILKDLQSAGNAGEFYTPRSITEFMVEIANPQLGEALLDPACGTGGFLVSSIEHIKKSIKTVEDKKTLQNSIFGIEKKPLPHSLASTNLILHDIEIPNVRHDNSLITPLKDITAKDRVDIILTNPPFGGTEEDGIEKNFPTSYQTKETADLFLVLIIEKLKLGGRGAVVLPDGTLFGEGVKTRIKEKLLTETNLHTIVRLPNGVFSPYTNINTNLLFFTKGEETKDVWFYEFQLPNGYKTFTKTKPLKETHFKDLKKWWRDRVENDFAWKVSLEDIKNNNFNLDIKNPKKQEEEKLYTTVELIDILEYSMKKSIDILEEIKNEKS